MKGFPIGLPYKLPHCQASFALSGSSGLGQNYNGRIPSKRLSSAWKLQLPVTFVKH